MGLMQVLRNMQASAKLKYKGPLYAVHRLARGALPSALPTSPRAPECP